MKTYSTYLRLLLFLGILFPLISYGQKQEPAIPYPTDRPLKILEMTLPKISDELRSLHIQGNVYIRVSFLSNSEIGTVAPITESPYLDALAVEAAKLIKFEPIIKNGISTTVTKTVVYNFFSGVGWENFMNKSAEIISQPVLPTIGVKDGKSTKHFTLHLYVELLETGQIGEITVVENRCRGNAFASEAIELARKIQFKPALKEGKRVSSREDMIYEFRESRRHQ